MQHDTLQGECKWGTKILIFIMICRGLHTSDCLLVLLLNGSFETGPQFVKTFFSRDGFSRSDLMLVLQAVFLRIPNLLFDAQWASEVLGLD